MSTIFISHVEEDQSVAFELADGLEACGYRTWLYERDGIPGAPYLQVVLEAVAEASAVIVLLSHASLGSEQVDREILMAYTRKPLVPVLWRLAHAEFEQQRPTWAAAFGAATSIAVPPAGCAAIIEPIVRGLKWLEIEPGPRPNTPAWEREGTSVGEQIVGPDGGTYVWVPPGEFLMGADDLPRCGPAHPVPITRGFWLGKHQVTNARYQAFCEAAGRGFPAASDQGDDHPVVLVDWDDAQAYCECYGLTLPTEAQWEYAAGGPEGRRYPWGEEWDARKCCNWDNKGPGGRTFAVGSFPSGLSWCGALDMAGNVWEWCADRYGADHCAESPQSDPPGPVSGERQVLRGGSWYREGERFFRRAFRYGALPYNRNDGRGFRCARGPTG